MVGRTLSHYKVLEEISRGGMGIVYRALDTKLNREVAIKVLPPELVADQERKRRFVQEAQAAASLKHPNIAVVYGIDESDGTTFIAMELIEGEKLGYLIATERLSTARVFDIAVEVAEGLTRAHEKGIVHRDLKPANIMISEDGHPKIIDFGLAKLLEPLAPVGSDVATALRGETQSGQMLGTISYMSPEQAGGASVDHRSDVFSFGVVLYEMLTGEHPFQGATNVDTLHGILREPAPRLEDAESDLQQFLDKCLAKDPANRHQEAHELLVNLKDLRRESGSSPSVQRVSRKKSPLPLWLGTAAVVVLAVLGVYRFLPSDGIDSVAVLPFENGSANPDSEYLSDGITGSIIVSLSQLPNVKVISRSSAFRYKGKAIDPETVGAELEVDAVVLGRVVQRGDDLSLTAELVDTRDGSLVWSEQYSRKLADVLVLQEDLAKEISRELLGRLTAEDERRLSRRYTEDAEAYQAYLQGSYHIQTRTEEGFELAIEYFRESIDKDPSYALAYAGLADGLSLLGHYTYLPPAEAYRQAREAALKSLDLDDSLAEAYTSLGWIELNERRWREAEEAFQKALELDPDYAAAHFWYGVLLTSTGRHDESIRTIRRTLTFDPLSPFFRMGVGWSLVNAGWVEEAIEQLRRSVELDPNYVQGHRYLGQAFEKNAQYEEAIAEYQKAIELSDGGLGMGDLGYAYARSGREDEAREILRRLQDPSERRYLAPLEMVRLYAGLGEREKLYEWLEKADAERGGEFLFLRWTPVGESLKGDPKFEEILKRMGLE